MWYSTRSESMYDWPMPHRLLAPVLLLVSLVLVPGPTLSAETDDSEEPKPRSVVEAKVQIRSRLPVLIGAIPMVITGCLLRAVGYSWSRPLPPLRGIIIPWPMQAQIK